MTTLITPGIQEYFNGNAMIGMVSVKICSRIWYFQRFEQLYYVGAVRVGYVLHYLWQRKKNQEHRSEDSNALECIPSSFSL
jgi:hypothetical protein